MLVLSRKVGERILIGNNIAVTVVRLGPGIVRLGVEAPQDLAIVREEIKGTGRDVKPTEPAEVEARTAPSPS
jgi:carbon storage regulator